MANFPDRPNPIGATPTLQTALNRIANWEQWADDVEARFTRVSDRIADLQDRIDQRRINMNQLSEQIIAKDAEITTLQAALNDRTAERNQARADLQAMVAERDSLQNELAVFRGVGLPTQPQP